MSEHQLTVLPPAATSSQTTIAVTPNNCDREPIRIPGQIQPHGLLLVLSADLDILQISQNVEALLGIAAAELLGQPLSRILEEQFCQTIRQATQTKEESEQATDRKQVFLGSVQLLQQDAPSNWSAQLHISAEDTSAEDISAKDTSAKDTSAKDISAEAIILELILSVPIAESSAGAENPAGVENPAGAESAEAIAQKADDLYTQLRQRISHFRTADSLAALAQQIAQSVAALTGFDRVMVYRFNTDYSGTVIAEVEATKTGNSFLGLRYPATDIPVQARELYLQNWSRVIPQVGYVPVSIVPERYPASQKPLDLSAVELRSVSPMHIEYLQNMGVEASMSISLIVEDRLWGLIACHHSQPKRVSAETRSACEFLGQMASLELFRQQTLAEKRYLADVRQIQYQIRQTLTRSRPTQAIELVFKQHQKELLALVRATGAAVVLDNQLTLIGQTPSLESTKSLVDWLVQQRRDIYYTHALPEAFAPFDAERGCACGLLAISIFLNQASYHVLWFRPELAQSVDWAGKPSKPVRVAEDGSLYLTPRQSFVRWKEAVDGQSLPWQRNEIGAAQELRSTLLLTALKFSQLALQKAASEAQVASLAKSQFLARMSHELRTPLNAILGFTQLIHYHETLSPQQRDRLDIINRSGEHLLSLIDDVLETSRIEAGQLTLNESCFDLHLFIASVRDMLTLRASNKSLLLKVNQQGQVPQSVWGDESKLRQIVLNLVGNAIKFTDKGEVTLSVACLPETAAAAAIKNASAPAPTSAAAADSVCIEFKVSDTGIGIASDHLEAIFEPFKQAEASRQAYEGAGLGLSISRQNARLMGGDIEVQSEVDCGSTFTCRVRLGIGSADDITRPNRQLRRVVGLANGSDHYRILVAEDVAENRQLLVALLTTVGFEVQTATDGQEAVELWRAWQPHCIWMDLHMPKVDGYAAAKQIRAAQAEVVPDKPPTIIAISAFALDRLRSDLVSSGFDDYVSKPFQVNEIFNKMAQHLDVRYLYAEEEDPSSASEHRRLLPTEPAQIEELRSQIQLQPTDWQINFYRAVLGAREQRIQQLIAQISDKSLADSLQNCLERLRFDLLQQVVSPLVDQS